MVLRLNPSSASHGCVTPSLGLNSPCIGEAARSTSVGGAEGQRRGLRTILCPMHFTFVIITYSYVLHCNQFTTLLPRTWAPPKGIEA